MQKMISTKNYLIKNWLFKISVCVAIFLTLSIFTAAQSISLSGGEVSKLQSLVQTDKSAAKQFNILLKTADAALPDAPAPIETITTEGRLKGDPLKTATAEALRDLPKIYVLAVAYRVTADDKYLKKVTEFLTAWAAKNKPTGDPIDETNLDKAFEAYDLVKSKFSDTDKAAVESWFLAVAKAEMTFPKMAQGTITAMNNWNSHRLKIVGEIACTLDDDELQKFVIDKLKTQLALNLNTDGTSFDFLERDALHYHTYDLEPLLKLAIALKRSAKIDFYNYQTDKGASIAKSVGFLVPFVSGEKTHEEFVNTKVQFDKDRAKNGEPGFISGTLFKPSEGIETLSLAAWFEPQFLDVVRKAKNDDSRFPNWQAVLNAVTK